MGSPALALQAELRPPLDHHEAVVAAERCLECGGPYAAAPCVVACPADVDVPSFVTALANDDASSAARTIFAENVLGATCARVCPVEVLCEGACVLLHDGQDAVEIGRLQRYAADWALERDLPLRERRPSTGTRIAVIGAGPAGLAAAGELASRGHAVVVHDDRREVGGLARFAIAPYRIERDPLPQEARALERLGVGFELSSPVASPTQLRRLEAEYDAIVLAVGLGDDVDARIPGDDLAGVWQSLDFVEALKTGCPPDVGSAVVVVGGGNTAVDVAREAVRLGAHRVTLAYRRTATEMPAYPHEVLEAQDEGVELRFLAAPIRVVGDRCVDAVRFAEMRLGDPDESGRRRPEPVPGAEFTLAADTVVFALGQQPRSAFLSWIPGLELAGGRIVVDEEGRTGNAKYFAAGDATGGATVVEAVAGAKRVARALEVER